LKPGFDVSEHSVARYLRRVPRRGDPASRWSAFLANHREAIVACDFFTVPTLTSCSPASSSSNTVAARFCTST
jgi:hypothetical protein